MMTDAPRTEATARRKVLIEKEEDREDRSTEGGVSSPEGQAPFEQSTGRNRPPAMQTKYSIGREVLVEQITLERTDFDKEICEGERVTDKSDREGEDWTLWGGESDALNKNSPSSSVKEPGEMATSEKSDGRVGGGVLVSRRDLGTEQ